MIGDHSFAFDTDSAMEMADAVIEAASICEDLKNED